ncbi:L-serine ammonia-lyase, iron-sulfur-dependent, subunit alpha [Clostridium beijerinckii]|uniref:L-serine dehydratase n=1 Tax=Clostridium beijerinckii TaxID=1520 RepID=A0AAW3W508_CLOBE|nr:L-serine ammonia-lyase, iron-sulfur-dependent, subunit alpha [Clostridium beijerinckii]MBC2456721.1 L-serine ammonia-lyase, iron-sulfur-dependent, subunit alpha [Clostridium beijerinckii]MBC2474021.1 L-serine ammonia-lyase, iron-sulfur-dependent, subunit alpha [Clostridium beijerinckii]MDG5853551.1 L-serine ammonia-lyase, iron-sulfur-dependent, subunit alpha [Clostridium beijerinckii]NOV61377.1 L-serine dehydratase [Clostridium beijerinckii]NOV69129.1 L-serine dehydratase [Clostridium beije
MVNYGYELLEVCNKRHISICEYTLEEEAKTTGLTYEQVFEKMRKNLQVMKSAAEIGLNNEIISISGIIGGDAYKLNKYLKEGKTLTGDFMVTAMARALSSSEVNASMGNIVAAPTAGSCGIIPAVIISAGEKLSLTEDEMVKALFTATGIGIIIAKNATLSGAEGGCQAECGSAAAMASAAAVEMMRGTPEQALNAAAIVFKNILGLVCDPIAGLVEVPCAKRNVAGAISALTTADMVMAGVISKIPFDDTVEAMYKIGKKMPSEFRETALGGLAITETGLKLKKQVFGK